jgi:hypothetical protein
MQTGDIISIPLFARLSDGDVSQVAAVARAAHLAAGHVVVNEGEFACIRLLRHRAGSRGRVAG